MNAQSFYALTPSNRIVICKLDPRFPAPKDSDTRIVAVEADPTGDPRPFSVHRRHTATDNNINIHIARHSEQGPYFVALPTTTRPA